MAITIDYITRIISIEKVDLTLIQTTPFEILELDINAFRLTLKDIEDDIGGMPFVDTHSHNTTVTVGGVTLARVFEIINGYTVTFEDGSYAVNLIGANSNIGDVINLNSVQVRSSNSAGLANASAAEYASFNGGVWIDTNSTRVTTTYPSGTQEFPVNNLADAIVIAEASGFTVINFASNFTFGATDNITGYKLIGRGLQITTLTFTSGCVLSLCQAEHVECVGTVDGIIGFDHCYINTLGSSGIAPSSQAVIMTHCLIAGTITVPSNYSGTMKILDSWSDVPGNLTPTLDLGDSSAPVLIRNYSGGIQLDNVTQVVNISIDLNSGQVILDSTCTDGHISIRGVGKLTNNATGTHVDSAGLVQAQTVDDTRHAVASLRPHHTAFGRTIYWDPADGDDTHNGTTPALATATFSAAHTLATSGAHDTIIALSTSTGQTVADEIITISKSYTFLRGPGRDFLIKPTDDTQDTITINAVGVEVSGMIIETAATGVNNAITVATGADFFFIHNIWSHTVTGDFVHIDGTVAYGRIDGCFVSHTANYGIHINGNTRHTRITNTEIDNPGNDGIVIEGTTARNNTIGPGVSIYDGDAYAIRITSPATRNIIKNGNSFYDNTSGNIIDNGIDTELDSVWNVLTADHTTAGTTGKALSDAGASGNPWATPVSGNTTAGSFGELVGTKALTVAKFLGLK